MCDAGFAPIDTEENNQGVTQSRKRREEEKAKDTEAILALVKQRVEGEVFVQVNNFKTAIAAQYSKISETHELRKLITSLSSRILSDSAQYIQTSLKDLI